MKEPKKSDCLPLAGIFFVLFILFVVSLFLGCSAKYLGPEVTDSGVRFSVKVQSAKSVAIVGSFNQWDREKDLLAGPDREGIWSITIPLQDGRYEYLFWVDGEKWLLDPEVPSVDDGFGGKNSVILIRR